MGGGVEGGSCVALRCYPVSIAQVLEKKTKKKVISENKGGGGGRRILRSPQALSWAIGQALETNLQIQIKDLIE